MAIDNIKNLTRDPRMLQYLEDEYDTLEDVDAGIVTSGNALYDFLGQALWGAAETASFETLGVSDMVTEGIHGEDATTWEDTITGLVGGVAADYDQLTGWGKGGYIAGTAIGMLPSFGLGALMTKGGVKGVAKIGGVGAKMATQKSKKELTEVIASKGIAETLAKKKITSVSDDIATKIVDDAYEVSVATNALGKLSIIQDKKILDEVMSKGVAKNVAKILKIAETDDVIAPLSKEIVRIVRKNNPDDAIQLINMAVSKIPGLSRMPRASLLFGAAAYDALIGVSLGTMKASAHALQQGYYGVERDDYGQMEWTRNYNISPVEFGKSWFHHAATDAFHFAFIGPVKYWRGFGPGGTEGQHARRLFQIINKGVRAYKPLKNYSEKQLKAQITAFDLLSGGRINKQMGTKWAAKGKLLGETGWLEKASKKEMQEFMSIARRHFVTKAPIGWAREFRADALQSLPRMAAGVVAMNTGGMLEQFYKNGFSWEQLKYALGTEPQEITANVMTAMWFTRRPHSFHAKLEGRVFNKIFNTGDLPEFVKFKTGQFRKVYGSLNTFGVDVNKMNAIIETFKPERGSNSGANVDKGTETLKKVFDTTSEFSKLEEIFNRFQLNSEKIPGTDLETAWNKAISELVKNKEISYDESLPLYEKLEIAQEIIRMYNLNSNKPIDTMTFTPKAGFDLVNEVAAITFNGETLTRVNIGEVLPRFAEKAVAKSAEIPKEILQNFLVKVNQALGKTYTQDPDSNILEARHLFGEHSALDPGFIEAFEQIQLIAAKNNWFKPSVGRDKVDYTAEEAAKLNEIFLESSKDMMTFAHGKGWDATRQLDDVILINDAWGLTYHEALKVKQRVDAYDLLTGNPDNNLPPAAVVEFNDLVSKYVAFREAPEITKGTGGKESEYGEIQQFVENLHRVVKRLNPQLISDRSPSNLTVEQAKGLMEKTEKLTGDLFTNADLFNRFEDTILRKSMDGMGMNDFALGYDIKVGLEYLSRDILTNPRTSTDIKLPNIIEMKDAIRVAVKGGKLDGDYAKELELFYNSIVGEVQKSKFPIDFSTGQVEKTTGDWVLAVRKAHSKAIRYMDKYSDQTARKNATFLTGEERRFQRMVGNIESGLDMLSGDLRKEASKKLRELIATREQVSSLNDLVRKAIEEGDPYLLRAVAKTEGDIMSALKTIESKGSDSGSLETYQKALLAAELKITNTARKEVFNEADIYTWIEQQVREWDIPNKDHEAITYKLSLSQFSNKYTITPKELNELLDFDRGGIKDAKELQVWTENLLRDYYNDPAQIRDPNARATLLQIQATLKNFSGQISIDVNTPEGQKNFNDAVIEPVKLRMKLSLQDMAAIHRQKISDADIFRDLYSIMSNYYSKTQVRVLKVNLRDNQLMQSNKVVGNAVDRGFTAILDLLDKNQSNIYLAEKTGVNSDGSNILDISGNDLKVINKALQDGNMNIYNQKAKLDIYRFDDTGAINDQNRIIGVGGKGRYIAIPMNDATTLIVRTDNHGPGSIHNQLKAQFRPENTADGDPGGELYLKLREIYDGDLTMNTPEVLAIRTLLNRVQDPQTSNDVVIGMKLTRMITNMPLNLRDVVERNDINLNHELVKKIQKRDRMTEPKNGFIPTIENLIKSRLLYEGAESQFHKDVYNQVKDWFDPNKKLRTLSIDDGGDLTDASGRKLLNIFSALDKRRVELDDLLARKEISKDEHTAELREMEAITKERTDGEMFLRRDPQLAFMSMIGIDPEMVVQNSLREIIGFTSGGIKPIITYSDINLSTGEISQWFGKTAFKYSRTMDQIMEALGVDAITFASANKMNLHKANRTSDVVSRYVSPRGLDYTTDAGKNYMRGTWVDFLRNAQQNLPNYQNNIVEIPLSSMSLRTISTPHDPMVGQNAGVHMSHNNGIADWIGLDNKLNNYFNNLSKTQNDVIFRTALARRVMGHVAETGDPTMANSAMSSIISRDGLILEPWAQRQLEKNLISYSLNNGGISGGIVEDGSLDVMAADYGNLATTIRSEIAGRPTVRIFGEFLPSYYASRKTFKFPGSDPSSQVQNVIIQKIRYVPEGGTKDIRVAEGYLLQIGTNAARDTYLQVEGRTINKKGEIIDIDTGDKVKEADSHNRIAYNRALKKQTELYVSTYDQTGIDPITGKMTTTKVSHFIPGTTTLNDVAVMVDNYPNMWVGALNLRQPRNMMGDVVISKIGKNNGLHHNHEHEGNVSRMNYVDAIKPQDSDFDFDKSFNYVAAPGRYWQEVNKNAGHITRDYGQEVDKLFDPQNLDAMMTKKVISMLEPDPTPEMIQREVIKARGQFVKMHQTATYLGNIFRHDATVAEWTTDRFFDGSKRIMQVRVNLNGKYSSTVGNISKMATLFIDMYNELPSRRLTRKVLQTQNHIWFGENGIFEIGYRRVADRDNPGGFVKYTDEGSLNSAMYTDVVASINARIIRPLNIYLKYNKGLETDPSGYSVKAELKNYHDAYRDMTRSALNVENNYGIMPGVNLRDGLITMSRYFADSRAPYDIAMEKLYSIYKEQNYVNEAGNVGRGKPEWEQIVNYIASGIDPVKGESAEFTKNRIIDNALKQYVKDEASLLQLADLYKKKKALEIDIENKMQYKKGDAESIEIADVQTQLDRATELITTIEAAVANRFIKDPAEPNKVLFNKGYASKAYVNTSKMPYVIIDRKNNIKEVILPGKSNFKYIDKTDKIVENGRRFEMSDAQQQEGLGILFNAFAGTPLIIDSKGGQHRLSDFELRNYVLSDVRKLNKDLRDLRKKKPVQTKEDRALYYAERERILEDHLFGDNRKAGRDEVYRKALILNMLAPSADRTVLTYRNLTPTETVTEPLFYGNKLSEPVMSLLTKMSVGEYKGDMHFAKEVLNDIENLKHVAYISKYRPDIDFALLQSRMYVEPTSIEGFAADNKYLDQDVFDMQETGTKMQRNAAKIMVDFAQGNMVDSRLLYKASKEMEKAGIALHKQWGRKHFLTLPDGTLRQFGETQIRFREIDKIKMKNLGEYSGTEKSARQATEELFRCMRSQK